jgi:hypothetical protein
VLLDNGIHDRAEDRAQFALLDQLWGNARNERANLVTVSRLQFRQDASLLGKYWYRDAMLTPARSATRFVVNPSHPLAVRM